MVAAAIVASRGSNSARATRAKTRRRAFLTADRLGSGFPTPPPIEDVQVDHRSADVVMPEQLLHVCSIWVDRFRTRGYESGAGRKEFCCFSSAGTGAREPY